MRAWIWLCSSMAVGGFACSTEPDPEVASTQSPIVNGQVDNGDPAVGFLVMMATVNGTRQAYASCTATLVAARTLATARHCVRNPEASDGLPEGYVFPAADLYVQFATQPGAADKKYGVLKTQFHPDADLAVVQLSEPGPATPVPMHTGALAALVGREVRLAGFGISASGRNDGGLKRTGRLTLLALESGGSEFGELAITGRSDAVNAPTSGLCSGDSGGPTFITVDGVEVLMGVNSFVARPVGVPGDGPPQCQDATTINGEVQVNVYHQWIQDFIAAEDQNNNVANSARASADAEAVTGGCAIEADPTHPGLLALALAALAWRRRRTQQNAPTG